MKKVLNTLRRLFFSQQPATPRQPAYAYAYARVPGRVPAKRSGA